MEAASRGSKQSRDSHFDLVPTELRAPCLPSQIFPWLTLALMYKLLWTSHTKFPSGRAHFYSPSTGFTSGRSASGGDKMNLQELWIWHQNGARVSSNWILLGLNLQGKSTSFVHLEFREKTRELWIKMALEQLLRASYCFNTHFFPSSLLIQIQADINMQMKLHKFTRNSAFPLKFPTRPCLLDCKARF